ncbi:MAG TPA: alpha/beta hydrolase [Acidimicrobiales bacterium]|nr:alpha/beta hydrolase [Acidimicrobiales bacterium]
MASAPRAAGPPPPALFLTEPVRAAAEWSAFAAAFPVLAATLPRGDGHPVLVLPGFIASDRSTVPLRRLLRRLGYHVHGWRLGRNLGPTPELVGGLGDRFRELADRHGRPISLVGWSLGGVYARELARRAPGATRVVVTLGSPFRLRDPRMSSIGALWAGTPASRAHPARHLEPEERRPRLPVPVTAVYTRGDGVVRWQLCVEDDGPRHESVEVRGSHSGLGCNIQAVRVIADRLAQPEGTWAPYRQAGDASDRGGRRPR